jgi:hypothetical protein
LSNRNILVMKKLIQAFLIVLFVFGGMTFLQAQDSVEVELRNPVTTPGSPATLQFDVYVKANNPGTYYGSLGTFLQFDQADLGGDPVMTVAKADMLTTPPAGGNYTASVTKSGNIFNITTSNGGLFFSFPATSPLFPTFNVEVPTTFTKYVTVTVEYPGSTIVPTSIDLLQDDAPPTPYDNGIYSRTTTGSSISQYGFNYGVSTLAFGSLPVEWLDFTAEKLQDDRIRLNWQTATEVNNDYFEVQRSVDGELFESIGKVDGAGTTTSMSDYEFFDNNYPSSRLFYRVKQVDLSGEVSFSSIASVEFGEGDNVSFFVYPGLVMDETELNAELVGEITERYDFVIVDQLGKTIYTAQIDNNNPRLKIPVDHLADGIYYYRLTKGLDEVKHGRFMKVEK